MRHMFSIGDNKVVCISKYAGKPVRGIAKCDPEYDEFDVETGKELAQSRCDVKVANKRVANLQRKLYGALNTLEQAKRNVEQLESALHLAVNESVEAQDKLNLLEVKLSK